MESEKIITFLFGAGSAGTIIGTLMIWRVQRMWDHIDAIPQLIKAIKDMKTAIDGFSGELKSIERLMYSNQKDVAIVNQKVEAAFRNIDSINRKLEI